MAVQPPRQFAPRSDEFASPLDHEIMAEKAAALGRAGEKVEITLRRLTVCDQGSAERDHHLREAAKAVYAYFIQRELCGLRRHRDAIQDFGIPADVLARLGAS